MNEDLHRRILERLQGHLDPDDFQLCVVDLWRGDYRLVPILGGSDGGMDGAFDDGQGDAFPLIATTGKRPLENLRKNLSSYRQRPNPRSRAAFASSRPLTAKTRDKLKAVATEHGTLLEPIIDQAAVALRLVREPGWCQKLLGLSGAPSALSLIPPSRRPLVEIEPVGREADLEWLRGGSGDRVLAGQPGSGKTFLLHHLAKEGWGLFLVDDDPTNLANALQEKQPKVVIVDDAHVDPTRLVRLRQLRQDTRGVFSILAVTWEGAEPAVSEALGGLPAEKRHKLELMDRDELVEVIRRVGISGQTELVRELVNQSANKPGLAVKLAQLTLAGDWRSIADGSALREDLVNAFRGLLGRDPTVPLACFSMGGEAGMPISAVAAFLGESRRQVYEEVSSLAVGGVLAERDEGVLAVEPESLRFSLLRTLFFSGGSSMPGWRRLFDTAPSQGDAVEVIVEAIAPGCALPNSEIQGLLANHGSSRAWSLYASLGPEQARWALEHYPNSFLDLAEQALRVIPAETIPLLFAKAEESARTTSTEGLVPLSLLSTWLSEHRGLTDRELLGRRRETIRAARAFVADGGSPVIAAVAARLALSPRLEDQEVDPGRGTKLNFSFRIPETAALRELATLWPEAQVLFSSPDAECWRELSTLLLEWLDAESWSEGPQSPVGLQDVVEAFVRRAIHDTAAVKGLSPGIRSALARLGRRVGDSPKIELDPEFERLFPDDSLFGEDWKQREAEHKRAIEEGIPVWASYGPEEAARRLALLEAEAKKIQQAWPRYTPLLASGLAERALEPDRWLDAFVAAELPADIVHPLLARLVSLPSEWWKDRVIAMLRAPAYSWVALDSVLALESLPSQLLELALEAAPSRMQAVFNLCSRGEAPLATLQKLLSHPDRPTALRAALGEWNAEPGGSVRPAVDALWRRAILDAPADERTPQIGFLLTRILQADPSLAYDWLLTRASAGDRFSGSGGTKTWEAACRTLTPQLRLELAANLPSQPGVRGLIRVLAKSDVAVASRILARRELSGHHTATVEGLPEGAWPERAALALEAGLTAEEIAKAAIRGDTSVYAGGGVSHWQKWMDAFDSLQQSPSPGVREIGRVGRTLATAEKEQGEAAEQHHRLHGTWS